jgi:hypothetical protein
MKNWLIAGLGVVGVILFAALLRVDMELADRNDTPTVNGELMMRVKVQPEVQSVWLSVDSPDNKLGRGVRVDPSNFDIYIDTTKLSDGEHLLLARAYLANGRSADIQGMKVRVKN